MIETAELRFAARTLNRLRVVDVSTHIDRDGALVRGRRRGTGMQQIETHVSYPLDTSAEHPSARAVLTREQAMCSQMRGAHPRSPADNVALQRDARLQFVLQ